MRMQEPRNGTIRPSRRRGPRPAAAPPSPVRAALCLAALAFAAGCKSRNLVWQAERKAQIGGEFIRLYDDGHAEYGYGVVTEKLKAEGAYRLAADTLWLLDPSFRAHFPKGYLPVRHGVVLMESGLHFQVAPPAPVP